MSIALVSTSVLFVVGAERAFMRLGDVIVRLADGGSAQTATIDVRRCTRCPALLATSPVLQQLVERSSVTSVVVHRMGDRPASKRRVPVRCVPPATLPHGVTWASAEARRSWTGAAGNATVLAGASLAPDAVSPHAVAPLLRTTDGRAMVLHTEVGPWLLAGVLHERPALALDAIQNGMLMVPWREPFRTLCNRGQEQWQLFASDSVALARNVARVADELRTVHRLRPTQSTPWAVGAHDRFAALVSTMVRRFTTWLLAVPTAIAVLCGAGIFSVQALDGAARMQEFGVRRSVGATRRDIIGQLLFEAGMVCGLGIAIACLLLAAGGLLTGDAQHTMRALLLALGVAAPLSGLGLVVPGLAALASSSIAALEGHGEP